MYRKLVFTHKHINIIVTVVFNRYCFFISIVKINKLNLVNIIYCTIFTDAKNRFWLTVKTPATS